MGLIHPSAEVDETAQIDPSSYVWGLAQVREGSSVGPECVIGRGAYVGVGVRIGARVKIQNFALLYDPAEIEDGVFIGPGVILTNDRRPRSVTPRGQAKSALDWTPVGVRVEQGASIGAGSICVAPVRIGAWALVGAGSVVVDNVPDHALVVGSPALQIGWVGRLGERLRAGDSPGTWDCPKSGDHYIEGANGLQLWGSTS